MTIFLPLEILGECFAGFVETRPAFFGVGFLADAFRAGLGALPAADFFVEPVFFFGLAIVKGLFGLVFGSLPEGEA